MNVAETSKRYNSFLILPARVLLLIQAILSFRSGNVITAEAFVFHSSKSNALVQKLRTHPLKNPIRFKQNNKKSGTSLTMSIEGGAPSPATTSADPAKVKIGSGIRDIVDHYDIFLLDMWGVMHDGHQTYEGVIDTVKRLRDAKKEIIILSNSSQRKERSIGNLKKLGFDPTNDFQQIITSGELSYQFLKSLSGWSVLEEIKAHKTDEEEPKVFVFGSGAGDEEYCNSCGWILSPIKEADLIVARGTFTINDGNSDAIVDKKKDPELYEEQLQSNLQKAAKLQLPMLITNPDKIRPDADRPPMPGHIGDLYESVLRENNVADDVESSMVKRIGKPFQEVYDTALQNANSSVDRSRVCMVGDALETDITGGAMAGVDTIWILKDGIHGPDILSKSSTDDISEGAQIVLNGFNQNSKNTYAKGTTQVPTVVLPHFRW